MPLQRTPTEEKFAQALDQGLLDAVDEMLRRGEVPVAQPLDNYGAQAIHFAARAGHAALIELLVRHGADVNACDKDFETPLITAAGWNKPEALEKLLELGAARDHRDKGGATALFRTAMDNRLQLAAILVEAGADPNVPTDSGLTPLFAAAQRGYFGVAKLLVEAGARLDQKGSGLAIIEFAEIAARNGADAKLVSDFLSATKLGRDATQGTAEKVAVRKPISFRKPV